MAAESPIMKALPWILGGIGVSGLENKLVGEHLPNELKNVNLGIGGVSGLLAANPAHRAQVLSSLPFKQMGLFGIGAIDRLRQQQQNLTDTNLATAKIHRQTAAMEGANSSSKAKMLASFLVPAALGSGALAYYAWNQRKKKRPEGYKTVGQRGTGSGSSRKVKIDVPASSLPPEFFSSLIHADDSPRSRVRVLEKSAATMYDGGETLGQAANDSFLGRLFHRAGQVPHNLVNSKPISTAGDLGSIGMELTGLPTVGRTAKDTGLGFGSQAGGQHGVGNRYLAAGLGGALLSGVGLKTGILPMMAKMVGPGRLARQIRPDTLGKALRAPITGLPNFSQALTDTVAGRALTGAEHAALADPATRTTTFNSLRNTLGGNRHLNDTMRNLKFQFTPKPYTPGTTPTTLLGEAAQAGGRAVHGAKELGRRGYNFVRRHPYLSSTAAGIPLAAVGTLRDEDKYRDWLARNGPLASHPPDHGPWRMPLSSQLALMLSNAGGGGQPAVAGQIRGWAGNPFEAAQQ